ncbi:intraflagellar transport protein 43 homolog isoform X2 [Drosophila grimshawi]|uniref:GH11665 n=1 Tax=Drosophila grimshawi TaxID=7222 RepID=B4JCN0_DROGR|nr:intraflagellar transport protein 43 homolog isoform X2 [Drosophila grimshawi]EDW04194.1 GH11665 [Drosophila grimshawi]
MDWAEELKMTIRKTTARKGRRSKSRDVLNETQAGASSAASTHKLAKDLSIDITLDIHNESTGSPTTTTTAATTPTTFNNEFDSNRPPIRRVSGGWADSGQKSLKSKKNSFDDERFQITKSATSTIPTDDIPIVPDLDDIRDEILLNEIVEPPSVAINRDVTFKELSSDLLSQNAFSAIEDVDLSILTRCLQAQENLDEPDEVWEWEKLFTGITAQINSDKTSSVGMPEKIEIGPDEIPSTAKLN